MRVNGHRYYIAHRRTEESTVVEHFNSRANEELYMAVMAIELGVNCDACQSRSTVVLLKLGMGQVQNGRLYIRYRSNSQKTKQRNEKSLETISLCYSIAKSTLKTPLTFSKVEKTKHENFAFVHLLLLSSFVFFFFFFCSVKHNSKIILFVKILNIPNSKSFTVDYSYRF